MNSVNEVSRDEVGSVSLTSKQFIIDFYIKRKLTTDLDIMTELDGHQGILRSVEFDDDESGREYKGHYSLDCIKLDIPKPVFRKDELEFVC